MNKENTQIKPSLPTTRLAKIVWIFTNCFIQSTIFAATQTTEVPVLVPTAELSNDGRLIYLTNPRGDRIPDFSHCGYYGGNRPLPSHIPVRVVVDPIPGDNTKRIQYAIDYISSLPVDSNGFRGCILLSPGRFELKGRLLITNAGIVVRGSGMTHSGTILVFSGEDRATAIRIRGFPPSGVESNQNWQIIDGYVPIGAATFTVADSQQLRPGDRVFVVRPCTPEWIEFMGMKDLGGGIGGWKPGSRTVVWDREILSITNNQITLDVPLTLGIDHRFGRGFLQRYHWPGRITNCGIENLVIESTFDRSNPKDEDHVWCGITFENAADCWVQRIWFKHLAGSAVAVYETASRITIQDCISTDPVSEDGGYRRNTYFTMGQQTLFLRCYAENGRHDFSVGHCAAGPNAFVACQSVRSTRHSGGIESLSCGVLFDNVDIDGHGLFLANLGGIGGRFGWGAVNSVLWQCSASIIRCQKPPGAFNWAFGCWGEFDGDGYWRASNEFVEPESLYLAQLKERLGANAASKIALMPRARGGESNPTISRAQELTQEAKHPALSLKDFILQLIAQVPLEHLGDGAPKIEELPPLQTHHPKVSGTPKRLQITNGWIVINGQLAIGDTLTVSWWRGSIIPSEAQLQGPAITRFMPGRYGRGYTDDLNSLAEEMQAQGIIALEHNHGLWYDRRRDDHERIRRADGDVVPPFYEQPFARSGTGTAWDGLSKYDLTRFNPFYWNRLAEFATICENKGLILFHHHYFQHNILEAGAHWADFPWRTANNINDTGFPEPPNYAGGKRIFMAEAFYDTTHPTRRTLHTAYIRKCLSALATNSNVMHFISAEYTGPLHFVQFWIDTIAAWQDETRLDPIIVLSCTKDVQDAILSDPDRSRYIDVIDFRYWWRTDKGEFAPPGGKNLAPRQFERQWRGGRPTDYDLAKMAAEYKTKFPEKALICAFKSGSWAWLCAGGSIPRLPSTTDPELLKFVPSCRPVPPSTIDQSAMAIKDSKENWLIYFAKPGVYHIPTADPNAPFSICLINLETGTIMNERGANSHSSKLELQVESAPAVFWIRKKYNSY